MPIISSAFTPNSFLQNGHTQTLLAKLWSRPKVLNVKRQRLELSDGDFIDCDWVGAGNGPIVVLLHGLEGSIHSHYIQGILHALQAHNYRAVVMHFRGCSGVANRLARAYHSGDTHDLAALIQHLEQHYPNTPRYAIGYSLGGNVLLKWLGEGGADKFNAAVAVSVPYQLAACV
ncbi:MAG TPA: alpha/beta fold hydrolase, partial [Gammaproteobacteria bacterium]|nr:alpha/beta fold hydrolase [Gammaproteobacteria bacterium]